MSTSSKKSKTAQRKTRAKKKEAKIKPQGFGGLDGEVATPAELRAYEQIAKLQQELAREKDKSLEHKFYLGGIASFLGLCALSPVIAPLMWAIVIPLYLGSLTHAAQKCGVDEVVVLINKITAKLSEKKRKNIED